MRSHLQNVESTFALVPGGQQLCSGVVAWRWRLDQVWSVSVLLLVIVLCVNVQAGANSPDRCMGCLLFSHGGRMESEQHKELQVCQYPCQCPDFLSCQDGVSTVKDGCGCCYMCARQRGDLCSARDLCDTAKGLFCDLKDTSSLGVCKGEDRNPCVVDGVMYKDGEKFQPECSQLCTCQNGFYGCVNICPQELHRPSELTCHEPTLIQVKNKCCKEWTCQKIEASGTSVLASNRLKSDNLVLPNAVWYHTSTPSPPPESTSLAEALYQSCYKKTTDWTPCSVTCDVGVSIRIVVDPITCNNYHELQLCYLRPCSNFTERMTRPDGRCSASTARPRVPRHIYYQDCISVREFRLKFCSNCQPKCCLPRRTRTRPLEFQCSDGKREVYNYMWIKKCRCNPSCDLGPSLRRRGGRGRRRDRKQRRRKNRRRRKY